MVIINSMHISKPFTFKDLEEKKLFVLLDDVYHAVPDVYMKTEEFLTQDGIITNAIGLNCEDEEITSSDLVVPLNAILEIERSSSAEIEE